MIIHQRFALLPLALILLTCSSRAVAQQDSSVCYVQKQDRTVVNLDPLCKKVSTPQPSNPVPSAADQGSDSSQPPSPRGEQPVTLVPGQTQKPPIQVYPNPSDMWNQVPDSPNPIQERPVP